MRRSMFIRHLLRSLITLGCLLIMPLTFAAPTIQNASGTFHQVLVRGEMSVNIHQTAGPSYAIVNGDSRDLVYLEFEIKKDWLKVSLGKGYPKFNPVHVDIWVNNIHRLVQRDEAKVVGHQLQSSGLIISAIGSVPLKLDGKINLTGLQARRFSRIELAGIHTKSLSLDLHHHATVKLQGIIGVCDMRVYDYAWVSMYWVDAHHLDLTLGEHAFVQIAGLALVLDLEMYDYAKFAGRYLRAHRAFVKTHDSSIAQISAARSQHTLAFDQSHIDFYNIPVMKTDFMMQNGAVLDMREWTMPYAQEDTNFGD